MYLSLLSPFYLLGCVWFILNWSCCHLFPAALKCGRPLCVRLRCVCNVCTYMSACTFVSRSFKRVHAHVGLKWHRICWYSCLSLSRPLFLDIYRGSSGFVTDGTLGHWHQSFVGNHGSWLCHICVRLTSVRLQLMFSFFKSSVEKKLKAAKERTKGCLVEETGFAAAAYFWLFILAWISGFT